MKNSRITPEFQKMTFANFTVEGKEHIVNQMKNTALAYYRHYDSIKGERQNSIGFFGQPGSGKTHLLSALSNNLMQKKQQRLIYFPYIEGFNDLKDDFSALNSKLESMNNADVLFIDDLFKGKLTDWEFKEIMSIVNHRYLNNKPMLISTEHDSDSLCKIDDALGSRIYQMTKEYSVTIKGDRKKLNHRLK